MLDTMILVGNLISQASAAPEVFMNELPLPLFDDVFEFFERLLEVGFLKIGMSDKNGFVTDHNVSFRLKPVKRARN